MIIAFFNMRGVSSGFKHTVLKRFIETMKSGIVMLQKTMMLVVLVCNSFLRIKPCWRVCAFDVIGHFGGALIA